MKPIKLFEEFLNESQREEAALQKVEALPKGSIFDDAKRIDGIFKINKRPWHEIVATWEQYTNPFCTALPKCEIKAGQGNMAWFHLDKEKSIVYTFLLTRL